MSANDDAMQRTSGIMMCKVVVTSQRHLWVSIPWCHKSRNGSKQTLLDANDNISCYNNITINSSTIIKFDEDLQGAGLFWSVCRVKLKNLEVKMTRCPFGREL